MFRSNSCSFFWERISSLYLKDILCCCNIKFEVGDYFQNKHVIFAFEDNKMRYEGTYFFGMYCFSTWII
jgi:hypothetical protein